MFQIQFPQLDNVRIDGKPLPYGLIEGIQRAFKYIQQITTEISTPGDAQLAYATGNLTLTNAEQDVPGATVTLNRAGTYLVTGNFLFLESGAGDVGLIFRGRSNFGGTSNTTNEALEVALALGQSGQATQQWMYRAPSAGIVVKLRALKSAVTAGTSTVQANHTSISALWIAQ